MKNTKSANGTKKVVLVKKPLKEEEIEDQVEEQVTPTQNAGIVKFRGLKFKKAGYDLARNDRAGSRVEYIEPIIKMIDDTEIIEQNFFPLGTYKFEIISNLEVYIHVSLLEIIKYKPAWQISKDSLQNCR